MFTSNRWNCAGESIVLCCLCCHAKTLTFSNILVITEDIYLGVLCTDCMSQFLELLWYPGISCFVKSPDKAI